MERLLYFSQDWEVVMRLKVGNFIVIGLICAAVSLLGGQMFNALAQVMSQQQAAQVDSKIAMSAAQSAGMNQFTMDELKDLDRRLASLALVQEGRVTRLETEGAHMKLELESLSNRLWALLLAVIAQLLHIGWSYIKPPDKAFQCRVPADGNICPFSTHVKELGAPGKVN